MGEVSKDKTQTYHFWNAYVQSACTEGDCESYSTHSALNLPEQKQTEIAFSLSAQGSPR